MMQYRHSRVLSVATARSCRKYVSSGLRAMPVSEFHGFFRLRTRTCYNQQSFLRNILPERRPAVRMLSRPQAWKNRKPQQRTAAFTRLSQQHSRSGRGNAITSRPSPILDTKSTSGDLPFDPNGSERKRCSMSKRKPSRGRNEIVALATLVVRFAYEIFARLHK